jgi:hypothetical protein
MDQDAQLSTELARAAQAEHLLNNVLFQDAINAVKAKYEQEWLGSRLDDTAKRERCFLAMRALDDVIRQFETHVATGKLAQAQLKSKAKAKIN